MVSLIAKHSIDIPYKVLSLRTVTQYFHSYEHSNNNLSIADGSHYYISFPQYRYYLQRTNPKHMQVGQWVQSVPIYIS